MERKNIILGTDWWTDCDDAVAIRIIGRAHNSEKIKLLAICINACMECSVPSLDGFLVREGVKGIPLGIDRKATDFGGTPHFQYPLAPFAEGYRSNDDAEDAVRLYRRALCECDGNVEIIEIGFMNAVSELLLSGADDISPLTGLELVREKVSKFWVMAGKWDVEGGREHNFDNNPRARLAAEAFVRMCPVPITFLGWEVGATVISGQYLDKEDNLKGVMIEHGSENGRSSWDPLTVMLALTGDEKAAGYNVVRGTARVDSSDGANYFIENEKGPHAYVVKAECDEYYEGILNELIK